MVPLIELVPKPAWLLVPEDFFKDALSMRALLLGDYRGSTPEPSLLNDESKRNFFLRFARETARDRLSSTDFDDDLIWMPAPAPDAGIRCRAGQQARRRGGGSRSMSVSWSWSSARASSRYEALERFGNQRSAMTKKALTAPARAAPASIGFDDGDPVDHVGPARARGGRMGPPTVAARVLMHARASCGLRRRAVVRKRTTAPGSCGPCD